MTLETLWYLATMICNNLCLCICSPVTSRIFKLTIRPDFCRDMWLKKSCGLRPQVNMAASGREFGILWLQRCCCLRQQPTVAASGRKSLMSSQWATQKYGQLNQSDPIIGNTLFRTHISKSIREKLWAPHYFLIYAFPTKNVVCLALPIYDKGERKILSSETKSKTSNLS